MTTTRTALVTGARQGIGKATALALAEAGFRVVVTSHQVGPTADGRAITDTVEAIEQLGGHALPVVLDLADRSSIDAALDTVAASWGNVDLLVNNALAQSAGAQALIADMDMAGFEEMIVGQVVNTTYLARRTLDLVPDGTVLTVVNVGSGAGNMQPVMVFGQGGSAFAYCASKAAFHMLAPFLQLELGERVRAFTVDPGFVETEALLEAIGKVPGAASPRMPAEVIRWLATPEADAHLGGYLEVQKVHTSAMA